ncbi:hypothetical protein DRE_03268 [Drechslerella stenobrocha 248]|uniref:Geranylgeranyl transferase type-2 subunit alpha n=1 Tax=Drechslerella stenobrocha 248 TaxID=1043628 RepID=W7I666_9PEZI|nr:hypothetical protein DRE_03268 [Drechslerella stenobrocha 248]
MASHGIARTAPTARSAQAREQELRKIETYNTLVAEVQALRASGTYNPAALTTTATLLTQNPEFNSIWNYRRQILLHLLSASEAAADKLQLISSELRLLIPLLQSYPKCYWIWNYRIFLLQTSSEQLAAETAVEVWQGEMKLVDKMLGRDARNFHGWGYRRGVVRSIEELQRKIHSGGEGEGGGGDYSLVEDEFAYTTAMYQKNLSNFSAWHNRSKLIPRLLDERGANTEERRTFLDGELGIMQEALFTDPYDQSLHLYHHWLVSSTCSPTLDAGVEGFVPLEPEQQFEILLRTLEWMKELLEEEPECRLLLEELIFIAGLVRRAVITGGGADKAGSTQLPAGEVDVSLLKQDIHSWLAKLAIVDPMRAGRWQELTEGLTTGTDTIL